MRRVMLCSFWLLACATSQPGSPVAAAGDAAVAERPVPPSDLDARLIEHYPLRGLVLAESGFARVRFTVSAMGAVTTAGEAQQASHPAYAEACQRMLHASTWLPARDQQGRPVPFTGNFECVFEHPSTAAKRASLGDVARGPVQPEYGEHWFDRFEEGFVARDLGAVLQIEVAPDGRVRVLGVQAGSDAQVAAACREQLEQGPRWQPAQDFSGRPVRYEGPFTCRVNLESKEKELALGNVGAAGPLAVEVVGAAFVEHLPAFSHCFESAFSMSKPVHGTHWIAFQILPSGAVGRAEWVERPLVDEVLESCVLSALRTLKFPAAQATTLGDAQLEVGGVSKLGFSL